MYDVQCTQQPMLQHSVLGTHVQLPCKQLRHTDTCICVSAVASSGSHACARVEPQGRHNADIALPLGCHVATAGLPQLTSSDDSRHGRQVMLPQQGHCRKNQHHLKPEQHEWCLQHSTQPESKADCACTTKSSCSLYHARIWLPVRK